MSKKNIITIIIVTIVLIGTIFIFSNVKISTSSGAHKRGEQAFSIIIGG